MSLSRMFTKQWSFFWAGIAFGVAQIIYMVANFISQAEAGKALVSKPITVTTNLGGMYHGMEAFWFGVGEGQGLYGQAFPIDTWGPILGMIIGGFLVGLLERESRSWARYSSKMLWVSFFGGVLFSYGTRLADGCTLNHLLGGIPVMSIKSTFVALAMSIGGLVAFFLMNRFGLAQYFKHQETKAYAVQAYKEGKSGDAVTYDPNYNPWKDPIRWVGLIFLAMFLIPAFYYFFAGGENVKHSIPTMGATFMLLTLLAGIVAGFGMGKSGFGTECALVSVEARAALKDPKQFTDMPAIGRTLFRGLLPLQGLLASIVLTALVVIGGWVLFDIQVGFQDPIKNQLSVASLLGGLMLGAGAVLLIGCEIRSYMRVGLGYTNTLVGFIGFAVGYLPYSLFLEAHKSFLKNTIFVETYTWYQALFPDNIGLQQVFAVAWLLALIGLLVWSIRAGSRDLKLNPLQVINLNTEDVQRIADMGAMPAAAAGD